MSNCSSAAAFIAFAPQHISSCIHILTCMISVAVNTLFIRICRRDLPCHQNCQILILALVTVNLIHSMTYAFLLGVHVFKVLTSKEPCDVLVCGVFCYITRLITASCYTAHTTVLFGLLFERVIATKLVSTYERRSAAIGYCIVCASLLFSISLCCLKQHGFRMDKTFYYCSSLTPETNHTVLLVHSSLLLMLVAVIIAFALLTASNRKIRKRIAQDVSSKYQASENLRILVLLKPLLILHFIGYTFYFAISVIVQTLKALLGELTFRVVYSVVYFPSHYCLISTVVLWCVIRRSKAQRENDRKSNTIFLKTMHDRREEDVYFQNYLDMWR